MNYSDISSLLITMGVIILVYPITMIVFQFDIESVQNFNLLRITLGVGSALFGAGIGFGIGHIVYKKEKGGKDE